MNGRSTQARDRTGFPFPAFRRGATHKVAYSGTAGTISGTISDDCSAVIVHCTTDAHFVAGAAPTATTNNEPITGKVDKLVVVEPGWKVSAVRQADNGTLYVTELH